MAYILLLMNIMKKAVIMMNAYSARKRTWWNPSSPFSDWIVGLSVAAIVLIFSSQLSQLEQTIYDWTIQYLPYDNYPPQVAVIAIDEPSLQQLGDAVWQPTTYVQLINRIAKTAHAITLTQDLTLPHHNPNNAYLDELMTTFLPSLTDFSAHWQQSFDAIADNKTRLLINQLFTEFSSLLTNLEDRLSAMKIEINGNEKLALSFEQAQAVFLAIPFNLDQVTPILAPRLPAYLVQHNFLLLDEQILDFKPTLTGLTTKLPPETLIRHATGWGYWNLQQAALNPRQQPLVVQYNNHYFPSLALSLLAYAQTATLLNTEQTLNKLRFKIEKQWTIYPRFYPVSNTEITIDSLVDILQGKIKIEKYRNKIVLLGITAPYYSMRQITPVGELPPVEVLAHTLTSLLHQDFCIVPNWAMYLQTFTFTMMLIYLIILLPRMNFYPAILSSALLLLGLYALYATLLYLGFILSLMASAVLIVLGHSALWLKRGFIAYQDAFRLHPNAVESNRLLGLAFQGQGQLDMALEKFRLCPPDEAILGLLYNLALDYELKSQLRRAAQVYRYILSHDMSFRDVPHCLDRVTRLRRPQLSNNHYLNDWLQDEQGEKPFLGRYQLEKQLGKGAMGTVYLGKDPKLNRIVAIKTLALSQQFATEELYEATTRFFREASAAGRLHHSHIIAIYDAGEEHDLAYIAMEYFSGGDLVPYTKRDNLLPIATVINIVSCIAIALDYAHQQGVIHRDIKPANIMYNPATESIKITDFGIARITDANKTKTGIILGTPSYMSPEQLSGKQVDGRSDLFSLGIMLYQLLTGELPFRANSLAALMFKITNESPQNILQLRADIPQCLVNVVNTALQKELTTRYQSGDEFAQALRDCHDGEERG